MIQLIEKGVYHLKEMGDASKLLTLDIYNGKSDYVWERDKDIRIRSAGQHGGRVFCTLAAGKYRLYQVKDEPGLASQLHLELLVGEGIWQGFLLPEGLPGDLEAKPMIPVEETITRNFVSVLLPTY
ncbi:MAG: hypothetical protein JW954_04660 [Dehalococcoidaceae bacterium]|nr:hypothetical protein [Dehalococcoidaceae bacterium]